MRIAVFISHPIQYFSPLWRELSARPEVELEVFYFSRHGLERSLDPGFGVTFAWDIDLLAGHRATFLPRHWPTRDPHDARAYAVNSQLWAALKRGWDVVCISGYAYLNNWFVLAGCQRLGIPVLCLADTTEPAARPGSRAKRLIKQTLLNLFLPRIAAFLVQGGQSRAYFAQYGVGPERMFICPYSVDIERFERTVREAGATGLAALRARFGIEPGARVVMFCGKLVGWKRPLDVAAAVSGMQRPDVRAVFVGDGPLRERLSREYDCLVTGFVNQREIPLALALADVLVLSSAKEPYGMVVAEAQAVGVPAVVSAACGCHGPESVLQDGESGFVYPTGDVPALHGYLERLLSDEPLRRRMAARARAQAQTQSPRRAADGFIAAARFALAERERRHATR
jgi:glycosyltransferase involved in cell wall biosynthesis